MSETREPYDATPEQGMNLDEMDNEQLDAALAQHRFPPIAQPQDDFAELLATHSAPFALLCEDYELMTGQAGNLGGTEL